MIGYIQNISWAREESTMTAISTASGRVTMMRESIPAISQSPHHDMSPLKIATKKDRIFGYNRNIGSCSGGLFSESAR